MAATADDMAIGGNMAKTISFSTTPKAAEATTPIPLTMTVISKKEKLTNKSCNAIGAPSSSTRLQSCPSRRISRRVNSKWKPFRYRYHKAVAKLTPCEATVAMAAPAARRWQPPTRMKSSTMFNAQANATK